MVGDEAVIDDGGSSDHGPSRTEEAQQESVLPTRWRVYFARYAVLASLVGLTVLFSVLRPDSFFTLANMRSILSNMSPLLVVSLGLTVVLVMGDFDLSVGSMLGLSGAVVIVLMVNEGWPWIPAVLVAAALALAVGLVNGILIAYAGTPSFITTLAMGTTLVGIEFVVTGQRTIVGFGGLPEVYRWLAIGKPVFGINFQVWIALGLAVLVYLVLDQTEMGRYMYAVGGNPEAARLSGIRVRRLRVVGFVIVALFALVAGVLVTGSNASTSPNTGIPFLLPAYAAVFLGAAVFRNGQFNVPGTLVGVLFLQIIATGLTMMQFSTAIVNVVQGSVLIAAMLLSRLGQASSP